MIVVKLLANFHLLAEYYVYIQNYVARYKTIKIAKVRDQLIYHLWNNGETAE